MKLSIAILALLLQLPIANAEVTATATASSAEVEVGELVTFSYTKTTSLIADGQQTGSVQLILNGPITIVLSVQTYDLPAAALGGSITLTWTWTPTIAGTYAATFQDTPSAGVRADAQVGLVVVDPYAGPPSNSETYLADGTPVHRSFGDWLATPGGQNVQSRTYLRVANSDAVAHRFLIAFHDSRFRDDSNSIALRGNVAFQVGFGATPSAGMSTLATDTDGAYDYTLPTGAVLWLGYTVLSIPLNATDGPYLAPFTFTHF